MRLYKIVALLYHDALIFSRVKWRLVETFYFPITTIVIWGFFAVYMQRYAVEAGMMVLALNIFWNFAYIAQSHTNMQMMEDTWSGSLKQLFLSGINEYEYLTARIVFSTVLSTLVLALLMAISFLFGLSALTVHFAPMMALFGITLLASIALSVFVAAILIMIGKEYGFLAWTIMQMFVLLSAPFFTADVFPEPLKTLSNYMPYTATFENARTLVTDGAISWPLLVQGLEIGIVYLIISLPIYKLAFDHARRTGYLVKLT